MTKKTIDSNLSAEERLEQSLVPNWDYPYKVPENWIFFWFTKLIDIEGGTQPPKSNFVECALDGYTRLVQIRDFSSDKYIVYVPDSPKLRHFEEEDILIARYGASLGKICTGLKGVYNVALAKTIFSNKIFERKYVYWMLHSETFQNPLMAISRTAQAGFNKGDLSRFAMPLPPLTEQQRIVARIETIFAKLDEAKEKAQEVVDGFATRKATILHKAFSGELTAKWREKNRISYDSWENTKFKDFCLLKRGFDLPATKRINGDYPLVSSSGIIDTHNTACVKGPGVVTGRSGTIGKVFYVEKDYWPLNTTLYSEELFGNDAKYVSYYLQTFDFKSFSSSTAVPTLNRNKFMDETVLVPTVDEQKEIVRILDVLIFKINQSKETAKVVIRQIDTMKKAILARAFRGELGTNDPTEESAVELLKEII